MVTMSFGSDINNAFFSFHVIVIVFFFCPIVSSMKIGRMTN